MATTTLNEVKRMYGTNAERLAFIVPSQVGVVFYETDTNSEYEWKGTEWIQTGINGAASVTLSGAGTAKNRTLSGAVVTTYADATNSVTAAVASGWTDITIVVPATGALTKVLFCYDSISEADAAAVLVTTTERTLNTRMEVLLPGTRTSFKFATEVTRLAFLPVGANTDIYVSGI